MTLESLIEWLEAMKSEMTNEGKFNTEMTIKALKERGIYPSK